MAFCAPSGKGVCPIGVTLPYGTFTASSILGASSDCNPRPISSVIIGIPVMLTLELLQILGEQRMKD